MLSPKASILIYGRDSDLLETRRLVLEHSGARVWTAAVLTDFNKIPPDVSIDVVILCHTLSMEECGRAVALANTRWTQVQSLALIAGRCFSLPELPERVVDTARGPAYLLKYRKEDLRD